MAAAEKGMPLHVQSSQFQPRVTIDILPLRWRSGLGSGKHNSLFLAVLSTVAVYGLFTSFFSDPRTSPEPDRVAPLGASDILERCASLRNTPGLSSDLLFRDRSDRFEFGTRPTLIKNVTLWTGARNGTEIVYGDVYLDKGLVQGIGYIPEALYANKDTEVVDAHGGWVTPGLSTSQHPEPAHTLTTSAMNS